MPQPPAAEPTPMPADERSPTSLADLRHFLDELGLETRLARRTLQADRTGVTAFTKVLAWADSTDMSQLDINKATRQYWAATTGQYTEQTRKTYIANARRAITLFLEWVDNGFDW
jgi:site-specific recombinase XerD